VAGDRQTNLIHHGGPDRAVCLFSFERIEALRAEGHPIQPGAIGENLTVRGLDWDDIVPGVRLQVGGDLRLEITSYAAPCRTIRGALVDGQFSRVGQKRFPGWSRVYARVLTEGEIQPGDPVVVEQKGLP
ncbi:MAG TPA: MOSC domain-containing protein, partial [Polyangia bacterium]